MAEKKDFDPKEECYSGLREMGRVGKENLRVKKNFKICTLFSTWPSIDHWKHKYTVTYVQYLMICPNDEKFGKNKNGRLITRQLVEEECGQT